MSSGSIPVLNQFNKIRTWKTDEILKLIERHNLKPNPYLYQYILETTTNLTMSENDRIKLFLKMIKRIIKSIEEESVDIKSRNLVKVILNVKAVISETRIITPGLKRVVGLLEICINKVRESSKIDFQFIYNFIDEFISFKIERAGEIIIDKAKQYFKDNDVILTYGSTDMLFSAIEKFLEANSNAHLTLILCDSSPLYSARASLDTVPKKVQIKYVLISGLSYIMHEVTKVFIEPVGVDIDSLFSNAGTASVAMLAKENNVPVIAICPVYRFRVDGVMISSLVDNELIGNDFLKDQDPEVERVTLMYDLTPGIFIDHIICELCALTMKSVHAICVFVEESYMNYIKDTSNN